MAEFQRLRDITFASRPWLGRYSTHDQEPCWVSLWRLDARQWVRYALTAAAVVAQLLTIVITWPLWQVREFPPALPTTWWEAARLGHWNFGIAMLVSACAVLVFPRLGVWMHGLVLLVSCQADEMRTQPQFLAIWVLMLATTHSRGMFWGRWFLVSMWLWAGMHKLFSPEWFASAGWWLFNRCGWFPNEFWFPWFTTGIALIEGGAGLAGIWRPRWAAVACVVMHVGIVIFLSPWGIAWNYSVIPWNLATALIGSWLFWQAPVGFPASGRSRGGVAALLIYPIGFYLGWVDHGIANVLYSQYYPRGFITTEDRNYEIHGWGELNIPFPNEHRTLKRYFQRVSKPGDKLHLRDSRWALADAYYGLGEDGGLQEMSRSRFVEQEPGFVRGYLGDDPTALYRLTRRGVRLLRKEGQDYVYAVSISPDRYSPEVLSWLRGVPNLEQLQLSETAVVDEDLSALVGLDSLTGIGLDETAVTDEAVVHLERLPNLKVVEHRSTKLTAEALENRTTAESVR